MYTTDRIQLRPNYYPDGPYLNSPCIHCRKILKHTGAHSGVTWTPVEVSEEYSSEWSTCYSHVVGPATYAQHEPWEAIPVSEAS